MQASEQASEQAYKHTFAFKLLQKFDSIRERVEHYVSVIDLCPLPAFITSRQGDAILYVNDAYRRLTGKTEESLQGFNWISVIHPEDRDEVLHIWQQFLQNPVDGIPMVHKHRYVNTSTGSIISAITYTTAVLKNGIVGYVVPADCVGLLQLGLDLQCDVQKAKLAEILKTQGS